MGSATSQPGQKLTSSSSGLLGSRAARGRHSSGRDSVAFEAARPPFATLAFAIRIGGRSTPLGSDSVHECRRRQHENHEATKGDQRLTGEGGQDDEHPDDDANQGKTNPKPAGTIDVPNCMCQGPLRRTASRFLRGCAVRDRPRACVDSSSRSGWQAVYGTSRFSGLLNRLYPAQAGVAPRRPDQRRTDRIVLSLHPWPHRRRAIGGPLRRTAARACRAHSTT